MVDREARDNLLRGLDDLLARRIHGDAFNEDYYFKYERNHDRGVKAIAKAAWGMYSDDRAQYVDWYTLPSDGQEMLRRMRLFLRTNLEYEWPRAPDRQWGPEAISVLGAACSFVGVIYRLRENGLRFGSLSVALLFVCMALIVLTVVLNRRSRRKWETDFAHHKLAGEFQYWPFIRGVDFETAKARVKRVTASLS